MVILICGKIMKIFVILFFIEICKIHLTEGRKFIWKPVSSIKDRKLWKNEISPCADSIVSFEKNKLSVVFVEKGLAAKEILLPDNGILYFDQYTLLGETPDWQCGFSKKGEDVAFFEPPLTPNVFDPVNWEVEGETTDRRFRLHVEQIPSQLDEAVFPINTASRIGINVPLIVGKLNYSNQYVVNSNFVLTLEGQLVFDLGPGLKTRFAIDNVDYQMPNTDVIRVVPGPLEGRKGTVNSNIDEPQFSEICKFVKCGNPDSYCRYPVRPVGHCCDVCGVLITFHHKNLDFEELKSRVEKMEERGFGVARWRSVSVSISRVDETAVVPTYQVGVVAHDGSFFEEDSFLAAAREVFSQAQHLQDSDGSLIGDFYGYTESVSEQKGKIRLLSLFKFFFFFSIIVAVVYFYFKHLYQTSPRFRLWFNYNSEDLQNRVTVIWQNATKAAEDQVNIAFGRSSGPSSRRFQNESENFETDSSVFHAEFRNPIFVENQILDDPEVKKEIKEENFIDLDF